MEMKREYLKEHRDFVYYISGLKGMKELVEVWTDVRSLQEQMNSIAIKALKSNDILYRCRFCKHLWK